MGEEGVGIGVFGMFGVLQDGWWQGGDEISPNSVGRERISVSRSVAFQRLTSKELQRCASGGSGGGGSGSGGGFVQTQTMI